MATQIYNMNELIDKKSRLKELLRFHYCFNGFRIGQERAIDSVLSGQDTLVIMPTGGGKSLCYQLPALVMDGITIVVSPLIALMKDQVDSLIKIGVPVTFINSSISQTESQARLDAAKAGYYKLIYVAPERFYSREFMDAMAGLEISLFAVDEAHCISEWGHDFRPSYLKLSSAIEQLGRPPIIALTATATPEVKRDISKQLRLKSPAEVVTGFARPNLHFGVIQANDSHKAGVIIESIKKFPRGSGIIYAGTRAKADEILKLLLDKGITALGYHAGMDSEDRRRVQENFMNSQARVIVATNAFGLGIDKKDIRFVIHYDLPGTIEAYYQEAGRAGRDGLPSFCLLLYHPKDRYLREFFIKGDNPPPQIIQDLYELLSSYGTDNVLVTYNELKNALGLDAPDMAIGTSLKILEGGGYIGRTREKHGAGYLRLNRDLDDISKIFNSRNAKSLDLVKDIIVELGQEIFRGIDFYAEELAQKINSKKDTIMRLVKKLSEHDLAQYQPPFKGTEVQILKRVPKDEIELDFSALDAKRQNAYSKLDSMEEYAFDFGCRQKYILEYFGEETENCGKCDNCLNGFRPAIKQHEHSSDRKSYFKARKIEDSGLEVDTALARKADFSTKLTQLETYEYYKDGFSIDEIAAARQLKPDTVVSHLCYLIERRMNIDLDRHVPEKKQKAIIEAIGKVGLDKLKPLKEELGDEYSWDEIKLALAKYRQIHKRILQ